jgi:hypothetical protein
VNIGARHKRRMVCLSWFFRDSTGRPPKVYATKIRDLSGACSRFVPGLRLFFIRLLPHPLFLQIRHFYGAYGAFIRLTK